MKATLGLLPAHLKASPKLQDHDDYWDALDAKDVFFPKDRSGEFAMSLQVPSAFQSAGYQIKHWAKADTHPVWILRARRKEARRFGNGAEFLQHVIQVLKSADLCARKADLTTEEDGDRILVAFQWPLPVHGTRRRRSLK